MSFNSKIKNAFKFLTSSDFRYMYLGNIGLLAHVPDEEYLKKRYYISIGRELNLEKPIYYTEKLQWLKLYDHKPIYTAMVDKVGVKEYVAKCIGNEYVIPTLGVWERFEEIDFEILPNRFVLKCTHDSGSIVICKDKANFDVKAAKRRINKYLKRDYFACSREWPYKNVKPRIIAEEYMEDISDMELRDYKFFTFDGIPKVLYITQGRSAINETTADFYDMEFNHLPFVIDHKMSENPPHPPVQFELMKELASKLSKGTPQLRVDFYEVNGKVYFGEMTFFHCSGLTPFSPNEWDKKLGKWVTLPEKTI